MVRLFSKFAVLAALALAAGCASPTAYQPARDGYGYAEQQLEENRYRVSFNGNNVTQKETVEIYMLYRAAELTRELGYDYFEMADRETDKSTRYLATYTTFGHYSHRHHRFDSDHFGSGFVTGTTRPISKYGAVANILLHKGEKPEDNPQAYDARDVLKRIGPKIRRPVPANS